MSEARGFFEGMPNAAALERIFTPAIAARLSARLIARRAAAAAAIARAEADAIAELSAAASAVEIDADRAFNLGWPEVLSSRQRADLQASLPELLAVAREAEDYARRALREAADAADAAACGPSVTVTLAALANLERAL